MKILAGLFPDFTAIDLADPANAWGLMPGVGSEHQREANHIQPVTARMALLASELHRGCREIGKAARDPAQLAKANVKASPTISIEGLGGHWQPSGLPPQRETLGGGECSAIDFVIGARCARRPSHMIAPPGTLSD